MHLTSESLPCGSWQHCHEKLKQVEVIRVRAAQGDLALSLYAPRKRRWPLQARAPPEAREETALALGTRDQPFRFDLSDSTNSHAHDILCMRHAYKGARRRGARFALSPLECSPSARNEAVVTYMHAWSHSCLAILSLSITLSSLVLNLMMDESFSVPSSTPTRPLSGPAITTIASFSLGLTVEYCSAACGVSL